MNLIAFRIAEHERELLKLAAKREEINHSEFLRRALKDRAKKVLLDEHV